MPARNTTATYGTVTRTFHWLTALLILTAIPLGLIANQMPYATGDELAAKAWVFSIHKTVGVSAFTVAVARILWALTETRPAPVHPDRQGETLLAETVHWVLYLSLVIVPLSGWVHHAATDGFAPILWPLSQDLPFVPTSVAVAESAAAMHWLFTKILVASILLHIAGALKHAVVDRDGTLARMVSGRAAGGVRAPRRAGPAVAALVVYAAGAGVAWTLAQDAAGAAEVEGANVVAAVPAAATAGNWQVTEGTLGFTVIQMGAEIAGSFPFAAEITFDETPVEGRNGSVAVTIDTAGLTLGSVTSQAQGTEFLDTATHPAATFVADIRPDEAGYVAEGTLTLRGAAVPLALPFTLEMQGDTAVMAGTLVLDRRDFGIGPNYPDEATVGFAVRVDVALTARRP